MNKAERRIKSITKQKRRIKIYADKSGFIHPKMAQRLKTMSTPCSCSMCSPSKVITNGVKKKQYRDIQFELQHSA